jgi:hypothetical protein
MKNISLLSIVILLLQFSTLTRAQTIPNGDFEDWIIGGGPDLWYTNNQYYPPIECLQILPDFQAYSGNICAMGIVDSCIELSVLYPPILTSFDINLTVKPEALLGYYKYYPIGDDLFSIRVELYADSVLVGEGSLKSKQQVIDFTEFFVDFEYTTSDTPDIAVIEFTIDSSLNDNRIHEGSMWIVDYLRFDTLSAIDNELEVLPDNFYLYQNYPNPFNPTTKIKFTIPVTLSQVEESLVTIKVYDVIGNEITTLVNEEKVAGNYEVEFDGTGLSSGVYIYTLSTGNFLSTKKMILFK